MCSKDENNSVRINVAGCENLSAFKIVAGHETLFCRLPRQLLAIRYQRYVTVQRSTRNYLFYLAPRYFGIVESDTDIISISKYITMQVCQHSRTSSERRVVR